MKRLFLIMLATICMSSVLFANDIFEITSKETEKGWTVRMFGNEETRLFEFCSAEKEYTDRKPTSSRGALLAFLLGKEVFGTVVVLHNMSDDNIPDEFDAVIELDEFKFNANGQKLQNPGFSITFPKSPEIYERIMSSKYIKYVINAHREISFGFDLVGSRVALKHVMDCVGGGTKANGVLEQERGYR